MTSILAYAVIFTLTFGGVEVFRRWSLRRNLYDVPNERSSHTIPTPRGGGLIIVFVCLTVYAATTIFFTGDFRWSYLVGAAAIALVSWIDDLYTISSAWRFAVHAASALLLIFTLGYFDEIYIPATADFNVGIIGAVLTFFWIVWLTNAYNFMDGIDGIAGTQALTAGIGWFFVGEFFGAPSGGFYGGVIACAGLGFLILNWQPAKIFMGDVGSAFLGYSFAALPLLAKNEKTFAFENSKFLFPTAVTLVCLFAFDTLYTFGRRLVGGENVWQAHRGHLYQKLTIKGFSHSSVSLLYGFISAVNVVLIIYTLKKSLPEIILAAFVLVQSVALALGAHFVKGREKK